MNRPAPTLTDAAAGRWHPARLITAPHRLGFFAGALMMALTALWWGLALVLRHGGVATPWDVPAPAAHGLAMTLGFMPLFVVGFLFTAGPRWLGVHGVPALALLNPVAMMLAGGLLSLMGFHVASPLAGIGQALAAAGWVGLLLRFVRLIRVSPLPDQLHARGIALAGGVGLVAMLFAASALLLRDIALARAAAQLAVWGFLAPTFAIVSHRMLPFFSASALPALDAWPPNWLLTAMLATLAASALGAVAETLWAPLPAAAHAALALVQAPAALLMLWLALRWGLVQSWANKLLAMLHGGFVWFGVALGLAAGSHAAVAIAGESATLGLAPLHALTLGYLGATLIAMTTRVAAGHSGRPLAADRLSLLLYGVLQAAALLRVAASLWAAAAVALLLLAVTAWSLATTGWALRYGAWLGRPRLDGRPG